MKKSYQLDLDEEFNLEGKENMTMIEFMEQLEQKESDMECNIDSEGNEVYTLKQNIIDQIKEIRTLKQHAIDQMNKM